LSQSTRIGADSNQKNAALSALFFSTENYTTKRLLPARNLPISFLKEGPQSGKGEDTEKGVPVLAFRRSGVQETEEDVETKKIGEALSRHSRQMKSRGIRHSKPTLQLIPINHTSRKRLLLLYITVQSDSMLYTIAIIAQQRLISLQQKQCPTMHLTKPEATYTWTHCLDISLFFSYCPKTLAYWLC